MASNQNNSKSELHPNFPSGEWEGFYTYTMGPSAGQHSMQFFLDFNQNTVSGSGTDDVGAFRWQGHYSTNPSKVEMAKVYFGKHTVLYKGHADENGIWGTWRIEPFMKGGFHIWPKDRGEQNEKEEVVELSLEKERELTFVK